MEIVLKYKVKQRKTVNFLPGIRLAQSIFKRKSSLRTYAPPKISPSKRAFEKYKPGAYFRNFTVGQDTQARQVIEVSQDTKASQDTQAIQNTQVGQDTEASQVLK